jgi:hypothetical protein
MKDWLIKQLSKLIEKLSVSLQNVIKENIDVYQYYEN